MPRVAVLMAVVLEERGAERAGILDRAEVLGERRQYFKVLKLDSEYGLSLETWGGCGCAQNLSDDAFASETGSAQTVLQSIGYFSIHALSK
jgi:hypothetical protein